MRDLVLHGNLEETFYAEHEIFHITATVWHLC